MILVDTSVWIEHFRFKNSDLAAVLDHGEALGHPFVRGELACGHLHPRQEILALLERLPQAVRARDADVVCLIEGKKLFGRGLGWTDCHLLASALISNCRLWTKDLILRTAAAQLGISYR